MTRLALLLLPFLAACAFQGGCTTPRPTAADVITVEGLTASRGNEPFAAYVLETDERNFYVLTFTPEASRALRTPARLRVTGELYQADWQSRPFAHLRVITWEELDR